MPAQRTTTDKPKTQITSRDIGILRSVGLARYLTAAEVEWLHFAGAGNAAWRATHATAQTSRESIPPPSTTVYRRIAGLVERGYLARLGRSMMPTTTTIGRLPAAYALTHSGRQMIAQEYDRSRDDGDMTPDPRSYVVYRADRHADRTIDHDLQVGQLYAAIAAQLAYVRPGASIDSTWSTVFSRSQPDRVAVGLRNVSVVPDATFAIDDTRYLVEVETGANNAATVAGKIEMYEAYARSRACAERYGVRDIQVLWIVQSAAARTTLANRIIAAANRAGANLARESVQIYTAAQVRDRYWARHRIIVAEHVHPLTIRRGWHRLAIDSDTPTLTESPLWPR